jgi:iron(III) transport system ATP-binding protein
MDKRAPGASDDLSGNPAGWGRRNTAGVAIASSLEFDGVSQDFGKGPVLRAITLEIAPGEIVCLLGPSGSGKTSLLRIAAGIDAPATGTVSIDRRTVAGPEVFVPPERRGIGLVFQDFALFPHLDIEANVRFGLGGVDAAVANDTARRMLRRVGLENHARQYPHQLSGGEQQRVALARALAPRPGILMMDEPFSGLDARLRDSIRDGTIELLRETRATSIIVTHDPEEAMRVGDRIVLLREGAVAQHGSGEELYLRPQSAYVVRFFSETNDFRVRVAGGKVETPLGAFAAKGHADGDLVDVCIRRADVLVRSAGANAPKSGQSGMEIPARITSRRFVGIAELIAFQVAGHDDPLRARIRAGHLPHGAVDVSVTVAPPSVHLFQAE